MPLGHSVGAALADAWIYFRTRHNTIGFVDLVVAALILCAFTLASGIHSKISPLPDDYKA